MVSPPKGHAIKFHAKPYPGKLSHKQFAGFQFLACANCKGFLTLLSDFLPFKGAIRFRLTGNE